MFRTLFTSLFVLLLCSIGQSRCEGAVPRNLQGKWVLIEVHQQDQIAKISNDHSGCTITSEELILEAGTIKQNFQLHADPSTTPPQLNTTLKTDKGLEVSSGIYNLVGNQLRICFAVPGNERPKGFSAHVGEPHFMWIFKRYVEAPPSPKTLPQLQHKQSVCGWHPNNCKGLGRSSQWNGMVEHFLEKYLGRSSYTATKRHRSAEKNRSPTHWKLTRTSNPLNSICSNRK